MNKNPTKVVGLMSGTSLDGVDLLLVDFSLARKKVTYSLVKGKTYLYPKALANRLQNARSLSGYELTLLDRELGVFYGLLLKKFLGKDEANLIASHGHTVFHQPEKGLTLQIGSGAEIAAKTGIKTICDFRTTDVALGGQGAPLVPFGDELLFPQYDYCLNLGGFSNISFRKNNRRNAYDISPCNLLLNLLAAEAGKTYDDRGKMAASGKINAELLNRLNQLDFYHQKKNKSLGVEWLEKHLFPVISSSKIAIGDKLATATEHIAYQIALHLGKNKTVLTTGGGALNDYLISRLKQLSGARIILPEKELIHFKEALIFALLGYMREKEWVNTLSAATGAQRDSSGGAVYFP